EGPMEGVLVTAKKAGSTIAITVVTNKEGRYSFPASRLEPGQYAIKIRAVGFDLDGNGAADVAGDKIANIDLKLKKTRNLSAQLTNAEWLQSMPGTPKQKDILLNCVSCHTVERIVRSTHDPKEFMQVQARMGTYANQSVPTRPQKRKAERLLEERGDARNKAQEERAEFLASINLSETETWSYDLKAMPRPTAKSSSRRTTGRATRSSRTTSSPARTGWPTIPILASRISAGSTRRRARLRKSPCPNSRRAGLRARSASAPTTTAISGSA